MSKLTKSDIKQAMIRSFCYQWQSFNYETMQSCGFAQFIAPALKKIYKMCIRDRYIMTSVS